MTQLATPELKNKAEALAAGFPVFKFLTDQALVSKDKGDGKKRVHLTASSSATDLAGDVMSEKALRRMKETAVGKTMFLNHKTNVPEDVFGSIEVATLVTRQVQVQTVGGKDSFATMSVICLEYDVVVEEANPRAIQTWEIISNGTTTLGASVTIAVVDQTKLADGRQRLEDVYHLETSIVGVPCNQQSWCQYVTTKGWAVKAKQVFLPPSDSITEIEFGEGEEIDIDALLAGHRVDEIKSAAAPVEPPVVKTGLKVERKVMITPAEALEKSQSLIGKLTGKAAALVTSFKDALNEKIEVVVESKDLFTDRLESHLRSYYLYCDIFCSACCELVYWNDAMAAEDRLAAASEMLDAFKVKMMEVFASIFAFQEEQKSKGILLDSKSIMKAAAGDYYQALGERIQVLAKAGARNSKSDKELLDNIHKSYHNCHDHLISLGVECEMKDEETEATEKSITFAGVELKYKTLPELEEQLTALSQQVADASVAGKTELEARVKSLTGENEQLTRDLQFEKAKATTAIGIAERYANLPAQRPGQVATA